MHGLRALGLSPSSLLPALFTALLLGCSSSGSTATTPEDASVSLSDAQGNVAEASVADSAASPPADTGTSDAGTTVSCMSPDASSCRMCCASAYPAGFKSFAALELTCACAPSLCGPLDGGAGEAGSAEDAGDAGSTDDAGDAGAIGTSDDGGDASLFGEGVCPSTCASTTPMGSCATCITQTLGTPTSPGVCGETVAADCLSDTTCAPFIQCVLGCQ